LSQLRDADDRRASAEKTATGLGHWSTSARRPFVGRQRELVVLRSALEDARSGRGRLILVTGEPGAGKTRLAEEVTLEARRDGAQVAWGRCHEREGARAFHPWIQILQSCVRSLDAADLRRLVRDAGPILANVVPALRERIPDLPPAPAIESAETRFHLFDSVARFLEGIGEGPPLVVVLDDLHEADRSSLLLLEFLIHELRQMRLLIVATYREVGAAGADDPLAETFAQVVRQPRSEWLQLRSFGEVEVAEFIGAYTGLPVPRGLAAAICRQTDGSPLFVVEFVRQLEAEGRLAQSIPAGDERIEPRAVRALIRRRLARVSPGCRDVLKIAATARQALAYDALAAALTDEQPPQARRDADEAAAASIREAVVAGILTEEADVSRRYRFVHALIRDTVYEEVGEAEKAALHRRVARALERGGASDDNFADLAHHWFEAIAARGDDVADKAVDYAQRAAEQAVAVLAYGDGARLYSLALAALDRAHNPDRHRLAALCLALGETLRCAGTVPAAREAFTRAAELARSLGEAKILARAAIGFAGRYVEVGIVDEGLCGLLEEALQRLPATDGALRVRIMARLAAELAYSKDTRRISELCEQTLGMAQRVRNPAALADAFNASHLAGAGLRDPRGRLALAGEIIRLAEQNGDRQSAIEMIGWRVAYLLELADMRAVEAEIARHARLAESMREPVYAWLTVMFRAMRALQDGDFGQAETLAGEALAHGQRSHNPNSQQAYAGQLFFLRRAQGRLHELRLPLEELAAQYPGMPAWRIALAALCVEVGDLPLARTLFERFAEHDFADVPRDPAWMVGMALLAEVAAALGDAPRAATLSALLLPYADRNVTVTGGAVSVGPVSRYLGLLARAMGRNDDAECHLTAALEIGGHLRARPIIAHVQSELAELLLYRRGPSDDARAAELLSHAGATASELGMAQLAERVARLRELRSNAVAPRDAERGADVQAKPLVAAAEPAARNAGSNALTREGEYWTFHYRGAICRVRDRAGLGYLAVLLARPHEEVPALMLVVGPNGGAGGNGAAQTDRGQLRAGWPSDLGDVIDARARAEYRERLEDLAAQLDDADRAHDLGQAERLRAEIEMLRAALGSALGLGGRARRAGSPAERARVRVTRALREAIDRIRAVDSGLGEHLARSVRTGTYCSYAPSERTTWSTVAARGRTSEHLAGGRVETDQSSR